MTVATRLTTQYLDSTMRESVYPEMTQQFPERKFLYNWLFDGEGQEISPLGCKIPAYMTPPAGNGFIGEGALGVQPTPSEDVSYRLKFTHFRHAIEYTYDALRALQGKGDDDAAFARNLNKDMARHTMAAQKELNRLGYGNGDARAGVVTASGTGANASVTFAKTSAAGWTLGSKFIQKNALYDFIDVTANTILIGPGGSLQTTAAGCTTQPNYTAGTAVFDLMPSGGSSLQTYINGNPSNTIIVVKTGSWNKAYRGLGYHIQATTRIYQTISTSTFRDANAVDVPAGNLPISVALYERLDEEMKYRIDEEDGEPINLSSPAQIELYKLLGYSAKRWEGDAKKFDGSFVDVSFGDRDWKYDVDAPKDIIYRLHRKVLKKLEYRPFGPIEEGEGMWKTPPGYNATTGVGAHFERVRGNIGMDFELGCIKPSALGKISGLDFSDTATGEY